MYFMWWISVLLFWAAWCMLKNLGKTKKGRCIRPSILSWEYLRREIPSSLVVEDMLTKFSSSPTFILSEKTYLLVRTVLEIVKRVVYPSYVLYFVHSFFLTLYLLFYFFPFVILKWSWVEDAVLTATVATGES